VPPAKSPLRSRRFPSCRRYNSYTKHGKGKAGEYTAFVEAREIGGNTAAVPALPGLVTQGRDLNDARDMAKDAMRCCIEGLKKAKETIAVEMETAPVKVSVGS
jgi:predicted RNase H-like HicB family nuclease